jgi:hypothetical protein
MIDGAEKKRPVSSNHYNSEIVRDRHPLQCNYKCNAKA